MVEKLQLSASPWICSWWIQTVALLAQVSSCNAKHFMMGGFMIFPSTSWAPEEPNKIYVKIIANSLNLITVNLITVCFLTNSCLGTSLQILLLLNTAIRDRFGDRQAPLNLTKHLNILYSWGFELPSPKISPGLLELRRIQSGSYLSHDITVWRTIAVRFRISGTQTAFIMVTWRKRTHVTPWSSECELNRIQ